MAELYRKSQIEKLSNPEQLDRAVNVTSPMSWLALLGVAIVIFATGVWSVYGKLPETQTVQGMILSAENTGVIYSETIVTVTEVVKRSGDSFKAGDIILKAEAEDGTARNIVAGSSGKLTHMLAEEGSPVAAGSEVARYTPDDAAEQVVICYVPAGMADYLSEGMKLHITPTAVDSQKYGHMEGTIVAIDDYPVTMSNMWYILGMDNLVAEQFASNGPIVAVRCSIKEDGSSKSGYYWSNASGKDLYVDDNTYVTCRVVTSEEAPITKVLGFLNDKLGN